MHDSLNFDQLSFGRCLVVQTPWSMVDRLQKNTLSVTDTNDDMFKIIKVAVSKYLKNKVSYHYQRPTSSQSLQKKKKISKLQSKTSELANNQDTERV